MPIKVIKPPKFNGYFSTRNKVVARTAYCEHLLLGRWQNKVSAILVYWQLDDLPFGLQVDSATANFFVTDKIKNDTQIVEAYQIVSPWNPCTTTWKHHPLVTSSPISCATITNSTFQFSINITSLVHRWVTNKAANLGLLIKIKETRAADNLVVLYGGQGRDSRFWPFLQIQYPSPQQITCVCESKIIERSTTVETADIKNYTPPINIMIMKYTYIIHNNGQFAGIAQLQVSADGVNWLVQSAQYVIAPNQSIVLVANNIAKYARIEYYSLNLGQNTTLKIMLQGCT